MSQFVRCSFLPGKSHDYLIAGSRCNAFCIGQVGSQDDFFLVGCEPDLESSFPLLTGNILDSGGEPLFRLVRYNFVGDPRGCSKIVADHLRYEIHDAYDRKVFSVHTAWWPQINHPDSKLVTTLSGNFYDKSGTLVFKANSGEEDEGIEVTTRHIFGYDRGQIGHTSHELTDEEQAFFHFVFTSGGAIYEPLRGVYSQSELTLDGKCLIDFEGTGTTIYVNSGDFSWIGPWRFDRCHFLFDGDAAKIKFLLDTIAAGQGKPGNVALAT